MSAFKYFLQSDTAANIHLFDAELSCEATVIELLAAAIREWLWKVHRYKSAKPKATEPFVPLGRHLTSLHACS